MESHIALNSAEKTGTKSLQDLPTEILLRVFSYIDLHREARVLGDIPDDPPLSPPDEFLIEDFSKCNVWLRDIALTCKRFAALMPEIQLHAVVTSTPNPDGDQRSNIFDLIAYLSKRPELGRYLKQLRICIHEEAFVSRENLCRALETIKLLPMPSIWKEECCKDLEGAFGQVAYEILLAMLPKLELLCISGQGSTFRFSFEWATQLSKLSFELPFLRSLRYLKVENDEPPIVRGLGLFQHLDTLDLSMRLSGTNMSAIVSASEEFSSFATEGRFQNIKHLRLDFEVRTIGIWNRAELTCMSNVVKGFQSLDSLVYYAEKITKNPYRSVRAFPGHQANIQAYPEMPSSPDWSGENRWYQALYDARTHITDYQYLVDSIVHLRPSLKRLELPGGFWTLPGAARKPLPRFDRFTRLQELFVPQAALVSIKLDNMDICGVTDGDFELSASEALPVSLQHLRISDVNEAFLEGEWLHGLFSEQKSHLRWPNLRIMEISIAPTFSPGATKKFMTLEETLAHRSDRVLEELLARRRNERFWAMVDQAAFKVVLGRDDDSGDLC